MPLSLADQIRSDALAMLTPHPESRRYIVSVWVEGRYKRTYKSGNVRPAEPGYVAYIAPNDTLTQHRTRAALFSFDEAMAELIRRGRGGCVEPVGD